MNARVGDYLLEFLIDYIAEEDIEAVARGLIDILEDCKVSITESHDIFEAASGSTVEFELDDEDDK